MLTYFCSSESNAVSFDYILLSSQVLRCDLRRCVMRQGVRQKNTDPHRADMNSAGVGVEIWVGVARHSQAIHPDLLDLFRLKGLQCTLDEHHD